jgi:Fe-S oxidoreductase
MDAYTAVRAEVDYASLARKVDKAVEGIKAPRLLLTSLETCSKCGACAEQCHVYLGSGKNEIYNPAYRANLLRKLYKRHHSLSGRLLKAMNLSNGINAEYIKNLVESSYRCTLCRRCSMFCTFKIDNTLITRTTRALVSKHGVAPSNLKKSVEAHLSTGNVSKMPKAAFLNIIEFLEDELKEETGEDIKIPVDKKGAEIFFLAPVVDFISHAENIMNIAKLFHYAGVDWTVSSEYYDAVNFGAFFNDEALKLIIKMMVSRVKALQPKTLVIGECGHALRVAKFFAQPLSGETLPFRVKSILEVLDELIKQEKLALDPNKNKERITYHDPCNVARMSGIIEEPRNILKASVKHFVEMSPSGAENFCCGGGGGVVVIDELEDFRNEISGKVKAEQIRETKASVVATACANCKKQLHEISEHYKLGVEVVGVSDLAAQALIR